MLHLVTLLQGSVGVVPLGSDLEWEVEAMGVFGIHVAFLQFLLFHPVDHIPTVSDVRRPQQGGRLIQGEDGTGGGSDLLIQTGTVDNETLGVDDVLADLSLP